MTHEYAEVSRHSDVWDRASGNDCPDDTEDDLVNPPQLPTNLWALDLRSRALFLLEEDAMIQFTILDPRLSQAALGCLPEFLDQADPRPAKVQLDSNYQHGGGWHPMKGWTYHPKTMTLSYPGDPDMTPLAMTWVREEMILVYPHAWVLILQPTGDFEVARMD